jgi:hypothetical protein
MEFPMEFPWIGGTIFARVRTYCGIGNVLQKQKQIGSIKQMAVKGR